MRPSNDPTPRLSESAAELLLIRRCFVPSSPGFVGTRIGLAPPVDLPDGRHRLRHGHIDVRRGHATLSVPPSPGLDVVLARATEDLALVGATDTTRVQVGLDAGTAGCGALSYRYRWALAHTLGPVLHAVFGAPPGTVPPPPGAEPRTAWAATVLDAALPDGRTFRQWTLAADGPTHADLDAHVEALTLPVRARGHLEIDVAGPLAAGRWSAALAVTAALFGDRHAAAEARAATALLRHPGATAPWVRAATDGLRDPDLAVAARACLFIAYDALARQGAPRRIRETVAAVLEGAPTRATAG